MRRAGRYRLHFSIGGPGFSSGPISAGRNAARPDYVGLNMREGAQRCAMGKNPAHIMIKFRMHIGAFRLFQFHVTISRGRFTHNMRGFLRRYCCVRKSSSI